MVQSRKTVLQRLALPDASVLGEEALFWNRSKGVRREANSLYLPDGAHLDLAAYMNLFHAHNWAKETGADAFTLSLSGSGQVTLRRNVHSAGESFIVAEEVCLALPATLDFATPDRPEIWSLSLSAVGTSQIDSIEWGATLPQHHISLAICVTTFNRQDATAASVLRIDQLIADYGLDDAHLIVIDNGRNFTAPDGTSCTVIPNPNLGGSGGFARAMIEAETLGATHCLFMDDDASCHDESLLRTYAYLRTALDRGAAVSGTMIGASNRQMLWEYGAVFHGRCYPQFIGTDLSKLADVVDMELSAAREKPAGHYGGWWFFAFPLEKAGTLPFPFFVRGDDVSFSLANGFTQKTLPGVVSVQEDFADKESPLTQYLDLRGHLHHHLVHRSLNIGAWGTAKIGLRFVGRSILRMHYETADALLLAWRDMIDRPEMYLSDPAANHARDEVAKLYNRERWRDMPMPSGVLAPRRGSPASFWICRLTLNGHLVPFWSRLAPTVALHPNVRTQIWPLLGASAARVYSRDGRKGYEVRHSKIRFLGISLRAMVLTLRWLMRYSVIQRRHLAAYEHATTKEFWTEAGSKNCEHLN